MDSVSGPSSSPINPNSSDPSANMSVPVDPNSPSPQELYQQLENILLDIQLAQEKKPQVQQAVIDQTAKFLKASSDNTAASALDIFKQNGWIRPEHLAKATRAYEGALYQTTNTEDATPNILDSLRDNLQTFQAQLRMGNQKQW